ncbi:cytochrome c3 family protein [Parasutterella sp.]|nr:cytochrome c3 family protein [Parasutterella sp.]
MYSFQITVANIHKTHFDTFECLQCHKGHSQSVIACAECHKGAQSIQVP